MYNGVLPWQNEMLGKFKDKFAYLKAVGNSKRGISVDSLCCGLPFQFANIFKHIKSLSFE